MTIGLGICAGTEDNALFDEAELPASPDTGCKII